MARHFLVWKGAGCIVAAAAIFLSGCRPSAPLMPQESDEGPAAAPHYVMQEMPPKTSIASDEMNATPRTPAAIRSSEKNNAENQLRAALAQYSSVADEETRMNIEEGLSQLGDSGVPKRDIARTLGAMFAMEKSVAVKRSILNELYHLGDVAVVEVSVALHPNQPLEIRDEAISVLQDIGDKRAIPFLQPLLADPDQIIRESARDAIDSLNNRDAS